LPQQLIHRARDDDLAPVPSGARSHVHDVVGRADRFLVVLHDQQRIAQIPKGLERVEQPPVVPGVEADARFVQHVQDTDQSAADLGGQPDALALPAGERLGRPRERQVAEADMGHEA
jgi:hypothetical protein